MDYQKNIINKIHVSRSVKGWKMNNAKKVAKKKIHIHVSKKVILKIMVFI